MSGPSPVVASWSLPIERRVEEAWPLVSDTDRFNRAAGLVMSFEEAPGPDGRIVRRGEIRRYGLRIRWEERPFEFRAPDYYALERVYESGPVARARVLARLERGEEPDTCVLHYELALYPRNFLYRPVVQADFGLSVRPEMERALHELVRAVEGRPNRYDRAPALGGAETRLLVDGLAGLEPAEVAGALRERIETAPLADQQRLRPLQLAEELELAPEPVIRAFLEAVRRGVLEMRFELLCPGCRAPKAGAERFRLRPGEVHCPSCDITYDGSFPDSVDVVFRAVRKVREVDQAVACLLSPARTPHVLAREVLQPGEERAWGVQLAPGGYRLQAGQGAASLEVREGAGAGRLAVDLTPSGIRPAVLRVRPGHVDLVLRNRTGAPLGVLLERRDRPPHTLTAGRLFEIEDARELLPPDAVAPGLDIEVRRGWAVAVSQVQAGAAATGGWDLDGDAAANGMLIRTFDDASDALAFMEPLDGDPELAVGVAAGPLVVLSEGDDRVPSGRTIDAALEVMRAVGAGHVGVAAEVAADLADALGETGSLKVGVDGWYQLVRFRSALDQRAERLASSVDAPVGPLPRIDGYDVLGELGRGAMGRVLDARAPSGEPVVVKVLLPAIAADPEHAQRFYNEAHLTRGLRHPNLVAVHDYGTTADGQTYLVMERLEGRELTELVRAGPLEPPRVTEIGIGVLRGLQAAHDAGVVHRDIKPANIFVLPDDGVKVLDFGIAQPMDEEDELAARGVVLGSPRYMAPEQVSRRPLDGRADLYSTGLVMYECLAGEVPFQGADALSLARARLHQVPPPLHERCEMRLPVGLEGVVMRALERDPDHRFTSAAEMADALEAVSDATDSRLTGRSAAPPAG